MRGRDFRDDDQTSTRPVSIVNDVFVSRYFGDRFGIPLVPQFLNRGRRHEAAPNQPVRQQVRDPGRVVPVALAARDVSDMLGVGEHQRERLFEDVPHRLPVHAGRLHRHVRAAGLGQPCRQLEAGPTVVVANSRCSVVTVRPAATRPTTTSGSATGGQLVRPPRGGGAAPVEQAAPRSRRGRGRGRSRLDGFVPLRSRPGPTLALPRNAQTDDDIPARRSSLLDHGVCIPCHEAAEKVRALRRRDRHRDALARDRHRACARRLTRGDRQHLIRATAGATGAAETVTVTSSLEALPRGHRARAAVLRDRRRSQTPA